MRFQRPRKNCSTWSNPAPKAGPGLKPRVRGACGQGHQCPFSLRKRLCPRRNRAGLRRPTGRCETNCSTWNNLGRMGSLWKTLLQVAVFCATSSCVKLPPFVPCCSEWRFSAPRWKNSRRMGARFQTFASRRGFERREAEIGCHLVVKLSTWPETAPAAVLTTTWK